jgi:hypothetical protein
MFGIGPIELAFFLVIVLLAVGPERLPTFMRTVGKALRQVRNASREFRDAIGFDELMREGDPFRSPPVRPPRARPVPLQDKDRDTLGSGSTTPPPSSQAVESAREALARVEAEPEAQAESDPEAGTKHP